MKKVLVVGAGGFGREVWQYLLQSPACGVEWTVAGFLDDNADALAKFDHPGRIVGTIRGYRPGPDEVLVCALGTPSAKRAVCASLVAAGATFMTFAHHTAVVGTSVRLGAGCVLAPYVVLTSDVRAGDFVTFNCHSCCGHDVTIGDYSTLSGFCELTGGVTLGESVFMGSHATVIPGRRIGDGVYIGAGSAAISHLKPGQKVFGVPARQLA